jgi:hypothetical protein
VPFAIDARYDANGNAVGLGPDDPATTLERFRDSKRDMLSFAASLEEFLAVWRWRDWNELRVRIVGARPVVTTWVNGLKVAELDMATLEPPKYDPAHIGFEVHDNDSRFGERRWGRPAACRWRNIRIQEL